MQRWATYREQNANRILGQTAAYENEGIEDLDGELWAVAKAPA